MSADHAIAAARALGLGVAFTEHMDFEADSDKSFAINPRAFAEERKALRGDDVLLGIEAGLTNNTRAAAKAALDADLDFVVGSVHVVDGRDIYTTFFDACPSREEAWRGYLECSVRMVEKCGFFDSLGHIDYPSRYCPYEDKNIEYDELKPWYDRLFQALLDTRKVLELNTCRLGDPSAAKALRRILEGYKLNGGSRVTIGSDAHQASDIGRGFEKAYAMAQDLGLIPVMFRERKMVDLR
jgi:histidinol-phosphatase (PHP family)